VITMQVITTLEDSDGSRFCRPPYLFAGETELSAWKDVFDRLMADFSCKISHRYAVVEPLVVFYDEDVSAVGAQPAEEPAYLAKLIENSWDAGELDLRTTLAIAA
jgi:hypothetical protein